MKKLMSLIAAFVMAVSLAACGGGSADADAPYLGTYIPMVGEMLGVTMATEDMEGFKIVLEAGGKGSMSISGDTASIKYKVEEDTITMTVEGEDITGTLGDDTIVCDDMLGTGLKLTFAKEGTDAANPELYISEEEKAMVGVWQSDAVANVLGNDMSAETAPDGMKLDIKADKTVTITFNGEDLGTFPWETFSNSVYLDNGIHWELEGDVLEVTYSTDDFYYVYTCKKV